MGAFTINSTTIGKKAKEGGKKPWLVAGYNADVTTSTELRATPSTGKQVLESIHIDVEALATSETISIFDDADLQIGPLPAELGWSTTFRYGLEFQGAIKIKTSAARPIHVIIEGYDI